MNRTTKNENSKIHSLYSKNIIDLERTKYEKLMTFLISKDISFII